MGTLCYLQLRTSLLICSVLRIIITFTAAVSLFFLLEDLHEIILRENRDCIYVLILIFSALFITELTFLPAVWLHNPCSRPWLIPWLVINFLLTVSLLAAVLFNIITILLEYGYNRPHDNTDKPRNLMKILINSGNLIIHGQIINFSAAVKLFMDMRFKRRVSFSKKVMQKNVSKVDMEDFVALSVNEKSHKYGEDLEKSRERRKDLRISIGSKSSDNEDFAMLDLEDEDNFY